MKKVNTDIDKGKTDIKFTVYETIIVLFCRESNQETVFSSMIWYYLVPFD